jgi:hypothetical protein
MQKMNLIFRFVLILITLSFYLVDKAYAQLSVSNQMEYSHWNKDGHNIFENWTDISYQYNQYSFNARMELYKPPDKNVYAELTPLVKEEQLSYINAEAYFGNFTFSVGNYYAIFGRGLTLRTYEDRNLRVDNNILGLKANYFSDLFEITLLGGKMRDKVNRRRDRIYGVDGEINLLDDLKIGGSFLRNHLYGEFTDLFAFRMNYIYDDFDFYSEFAIKDINDAISNYISISYASDIFTFLAEYKDYNKLVFHNYFLTEYNTPPALSREHAYTMLNRHPHQLNTADERGVQFEGSFDAFDDISFLINYSNTETHNQQRIFEEYFFKTHYDYSENLRMEGIIGWNYAIEGTENITPIFMTEYNWNDINELHFEFQHQHTKIVKGAFNKAEYDDDMFIFEYTRSPLYSLSLVGEFTNRTELKHYSGVKPYRGEKDFWMYGQLTLSIFESQQITILYGSRQKGFVCAGGVCRVEPEFEGLEIKLFSRF